MHCLFSLVGGTRASTRSSSSISSAPSFPFSPRKANPRSPTGTSRSVYMLVSLLALLGASGSQSKLIEFICKQVGGTCPPRPTCPAGEALHRKPHSRPSYDGCGTHGLKINLGNTDFSSCCNLHDLCYGQCGRRKQECDQWFEGCMLAQCEREHGLHHHHAGNHTQQPPPKHQPKALRKCVGAARLYYNGVYGFGCYAFNKAQRQHCECTRRAERRRMDHHDDGEQGSLAKDVLSGLHAVMERASQATSPTAEVLPHYRWEEFL